MAKNDIENQAKQPITFTGRTRSDAKRKALNYWYMNQNTLSMTIREFSAKLVLLPDGKSIVFYEDYNSK